MLLKMIFLNIGKLVKFLISIFMKIILIFY